MNDFKVLIINESDAKSFISDLFTYVSLIACFFFNYNFLGDSTIITLLISSCFIIGIWGRLNKKLKRMTSDEALKYLLEKKQDEKMKDNLK